LTSIKTLLVYCCEATERLQKVDTTIAQIPEMYWRQLAIPVCGAISERMDHASTGFAGVRLDKPGKSDILFVRTGCVDFICVFRRIGVYGVALLAFMAHIGFVKVTPSQL
jgi:hypothetical protein